MKLDIERIMRRVLAELEVRRPSSQLVAASAETASQRPSRIQPWRSAVPELREKSAYGLAELLVYSDQTFVQTAYRALLRRSADQEGMEGYLGHLRSGALTKIEVLGSLRWSSEGEIQGVHVNGLLVPYTLQRWKRKRVVGPLIAWLHAVVRLPAMSVRQSMAEATHSREEHELGQLMTDLSADVIQQISDIKNELAFERSQRTDLHSRAAIEAACRDDRWQESIDSVWTQLAEEVTKAAELDARLNRLEENLAAVRVLMDESAQKNQHVADSFDTRLVVLEKDIAEAGASQPVKKAINLDSFYVAFEEKFRGSRELIRERVLPYIGVIRDANVGTHTTPVLDIGCGRGDWLDILREHDLIARGIDSNGIFVELCRGRGLNVNQSDVIEALRSLPDGSTGAITGIHIAEHLPLDVLIELIDQCRRVLCMGGVLILETPNPENIQVATHFFYMDPTHLNPLPPEALRWMIEARGFEKVRIERLTAGRQLPTPGISDPSIPNSDSVNFLLAQFLTAPDYAIIARRL